MKPGGGDVAPALILLERTLCQVLVNGNSSASNDSKIWVYGTGTMPASIHSDSDGQRIRLRVGTQPAAACRQQDQRHRRLRRAQLEGFRA